MALTPKQRALAAIAEGRIGKAEPVATPASAGVAPTDPLDPVAAKVAEVAKRLQEKRAKAAEAAAQPETAETAAAKLDPQLLRTEKGREHLQAWAKASGVDVVDLFGALSDYADALEAESKANPLEKRLSTIEKEREAEATRKAAEAKSAREAGAREAFLGSVTAEKFPLLAALDEDEIMERGIAAARMLTKAGEAPDTETIAAVAEIELRKLHGKIAANGSVTTKTAGSAEPRTLTGSLGGETPAPVPLVLGEAGRKARGRAALARLGR